MFFIISAFQDKERSMSSVDRRSHFPVLVMLSGEVFSGVLTVGGGDPSVP